MRGDSVRLSQVVSNLLTNAAKYTPPGGRITIRATEEHGEIVIRVRDTGIGIAPDVLPTCSICSSRSGKPSIDRREAWAWD